MKNNSQWSAEDLALIGAVLVVLGDIFALLSLLKEREKKSNNRFDKCPNLPEHIVARYAQDVHVLLGHAESSCSGCSPC